MNLTNNEKIYLKAKEEYYNGNPIMSDYEFDILEEKLKDEESEVINIVGSYDLKDLTFEHPTTMKSLSKIHVYDNDNLPMNQLEDWISKTESKYDFLEIGPKYDGSACNIIYEDGTMKLSLTRGDGVQGQDITSKVKLFAPTVVPFKNKVEIRGEIVIPIKTFNEKYLGDYANPRNFVAGKLGRDTVEECISDFHFIAFEMRSNGEQVNNSTEALKKLGFRISNVTNIRTIQDFSTTYPKMLHYRENESPYLLDGLVIKYPENQRKDIGEKSNAPKWAMAIKFPPKETKTKIKDIYWSMAKGGHYTPIGSVEPVLLDGTTVSNVSLYNHRNVIDNGLLPGAEIILVKSGDIIPKVHKIIKSSDGSIYHEIPTHCKCCNSKLQKSDVHISCINPDCDDQKTYKLNVGLGRLGLKHVAIKTIEKFSKAGFKNVEEIFLPTFNKQALCDSGFFKEGRQLDLIFESIDRIKEVELSWVIASFCYHQLGDSISTELAKWMRDVPYDFKGLNHTIIKDFISTNSSIRERTEKFIKILESRNVKVKDPQNLIIDKNSVRVEMTGSPKEFGYSKKSDFIDFITSNGYVHTKLDKECNILITDDENSNSSKMKKARKLGIEILTYDQIIDRINKSL